MTDLELIALIRRTNDACWGGKHCGTRPETECFSCQVERLCQRASVLVAASTLASLPARKVS